MWIILKVFIERICYIYIASALCFGFFGPEDCGISAPQPGSKPAPLSLQDEVKTTGPAGKSPIFPILLKCSKKEGSVIP